MGKIEPYDLDSFDTVEIRLRGDGRSYFFNIHPEGYKSIHDLYQGLLFTRGGPHWEIIRVCTLILIDILDFLQVKIEHFRVTSL